MHWRTHPALQGKLHPGQPDDLQVIVHDGGPRITSARPEAVWVTVTGQEGDVFSGKVLNVPHQLKTVRQGQAIRFVVDAGSDRAVMVTDKYLAERPRWKIVGCGKCGLGELFDAPSDLIRVTFPDLPADAQLDAFTAFCGLCGGVQTIEAAPSARAKKAWWKFW